MPRKAQDVTDAELAVLELLWERDRATVRELTERLYPSRSGSDLATVQKLLKRLEVKRCVRRDVDVWPHVYFPAIERDDLIARQLQITADKLCDGSLAPLLTNLVQHHEITPNERTKLKRLLDETEPANGTSSNSPVGP